MTLKISGSFSTSGVPEVHIDDASGVDIFNNDLKVEADGRTIRVPASFENATPGVYTISVRVGPDTIGSVRITVKAAQ